MSWVTAETRFPPRRAIFTTRSRHVGKMMEAATGPDDMETKIRAFIVSDRPLLAGCCIHFMRYSFESDTWEFGVSHETLPAVGEGALCGTQPLLDKDD